MADTLRYEAWTLPWLPGFQRVIADVPVVIDSGSGTSRFSDFGTGTVDVSSDYDRLTDIISATAGRLMRVYDGAVVVHEFLAARVDFSLTEAGGLATISGNDIASAFDHTITYPYDYPLNPSLMPNWIWGGPDVLQNGDMEQNQTSQYIYDIYNRSEQYEVYSAATGGDFTLTMEADTTAPINFDASASAVQSAINATTGIVSCDVAPKFPFADLSVLIPGQSNNPWVIKFQDPHVLAAGVMTGNGAGLSPSDSLVVTTILDPALTFTLSIQTETTAPIAWNASTTTVSGAIEALNAVTDVTTTGAGSPGSPWKITFVVPEVLLGPMSGTGVGLTVIQTQTGSDEIIAGWTKSQRADARTVPAYHGTYTIFRQSSGAEPVHSGSYSLVVQGTQYAGAQQIVSVQPGGLYQASGWIYHNGGGQTFRLVIRDIYEEYIASAEISPVANTWTQITIPDVLMQTWQFGFPRDTIVFRVANITANATGITYYDDFALAQGLAPNNTGGIVLALMNDAAVDHAADTRGTTLLWVDYSGVNETSDASGSNWPAGSSFTAYRGATYGQTWDRLTALGSEFRLVPKSVPVGALTHDLEWYQRGNLGTNYSNLATPAINIGQAITSGKIVQRIPDRTAVLVEGGEGLYVEDKDAGAETNFGRLEKYKGDTGINSTASLNDAATVLLDHEIGIRTAIQISTVATADHPRPLVDYVPGDRLQTQLPPVLPKTLKRVSQISYRNSEPTAYQVTLIEPPSVGAET